MTLHLGVLILSCLFFLTIRMGTTSSKGGTAKSNSSNKRSKSVVSQKLASASKTKILSLTEHGIKTLPFQVLQVEGLKTLDLSHNQLTNGDENLCKLLSSCLTLKTLKLGHNNVHEGGLPSLEGLRNLQTLTLSNNRLGVAKAKPSKSSKMQALSTFAAFPALPPSLKTLSISNNGLYAVPSPVTSPSLVSLKSLDMSGNQLSGLLPQALKVLASLTELNLDNNRLSGLDCGLVLPTLKSLSLQNNNLTYDEHAPSIAQSLPSHLFTESPLQDLTLTGNPLLKRELMEFEGFDAFLSRRQKLKKKDLDGGALTSLSLCGLD